LFAGAFKKSVQLTVDNMFADVDALRLQIAMKFLQDVVVTGLVESDTITLLGIGFGNRAVEAHLFSGSIAEQFITTRLYL
tara:strand:- start:410 stop:649 length:240 start_codon:yes stop_codon:yes gene_type:complete